MNQLDATQSAVLGVLADRKDAIKSPERLTCHGCGVDVFVTKGMLVPAKQEAAARNHRLYIVCPTCAGPFLNRVASGDGVAAGTPAAMKEVLPEIMQRRRQFLRSN